MSYIDDELAVLPKFEGSENHLYLDTAKPPNATTAMGFLVANVAASMKLPWVAPDGSPASGDEIQADWSRVTAMPGGLSARHYIGPDGLTLSDSAIDNLTMSMLMEGDAELREDFPGFDNAPDVAKTRLLDMWWNVGNGRLKGGYPKFDAAVDAALAGDPTKWLIAAQECGRDTKDPAFAGRNSWTVQGFIAAANSVAAPTAPGVG